MFSLFADSVMCLFVQSLLIDLHPNPEPTPMSAGGHISQLSWHYFTHGLNNTSQLGSSVIM